MLLGMAAPGPLCVHNSPVPEITLGADMELTQAIGGASLIFSQTSGVALVGNDHTLTGVAECRCFFVNGDNSSVSIYDLTVDSCVITTATGGAFGI